MKGPLGRRTLLWPLAALLLLGAGEGFAQQAATQASAHRPRRTLSIAFTRGGDPRTERRRGARNRPRSEARHRHARHRTRAADAGPGDERSFPGGEGRLHPPGESSRYHHVDERGGAPRGLPPPARG